MSSRSLLTIFINSLSDLIFSCKYFLIDSCSFFRAAISFSIFLILLYFTIFLTSLRIYVNIIRHTDTIVKIFLLSL
nr:MAG TPA: hypothetical protein [Caudoviricetes sp.]